MNSPERRGEPGPDNFVEPQRHDINSYVFTLSGGPGTGTTAVGEILSQQLETKFTKRGEIFKRWDRRFGAKTGVIGFAPRSTDVDKAMDQKTENRMIRANETETPLIVESRLGALIAKGLQDAGKITAGPRIILTVSDEKAAQRVWRRESRKNLNFNKTVENVEADLQERRTKDLEQWWETYPELTGQDPMDPNFTDAKGERIYNIVINTDNLSVSQVVKTIYSELLARGYLTEPSK